MSQQAMVVDWASRRREMVARQVEERGIRDTRILEALRRIPRERFVPEALRNRCCEDDPLPIGFEQTISQPYITALMVECLHLNGTETVLEIGAGCGYHAAVLGALSARVVTVEIIPELAEMARMNLKETNLGDNIEVICGDASSGWPERAPFHAISVAAAAPELPPALLDQLTDPGVMVIPVGSYWEQELRVITKNQGVVHSRLATYCRFVPLRGPGAWQ